MKGAEKRRKVQEETARKESPISAKWLPKP